MYLFSSSKDPLQVKNDKYSLYCTFTSSEVIIYMISFIEDTYIIEIFNTLGIILLSIV